VWRKLVVIIPICMLGVILSGLRAFRANPSDPWESLALVYGVCLGVTLVIVGSVVLVMRRSVQDAREQDPESFLVAASASKELAESLSAVTGAKVSMSMTTTVLVGQQGVRFSTSDADVAVPWDLIIEVETGRENPGGFWWSSSAPPMGAIIPVAWIDGAKRRLPILPLGPNGVMPAGADRLRLVRDAVWDSWRTASLPRLNETS
jgi:hypothetical protein